MEVLLPVLPEAIQEDLPGVLPEVLPERLLAAWRDEEEGSGAAVLTGIPDIRGTLVTNRRFYVESKKIHIQSGTGLFDLAPLFH